jgi:hypothetical protein
MTPEIKEAFIELSMALEPERLYQDGERTQEEVDAALKEINSIWKHLEKVHQVEVSFEEAEQWSWNREVIL